MQKINNNGFTLIEVLLASVILFMFLTMASIAFKQSAEASIKAERAAKVAATVPLLLENIRLKIAEAQSPAIVNGADKFLDLSYQWEARLIERKAPADRFDPSELEFKSYEDKFNRWQVKLTVSLGSYQRSWQYEEISWYQ